jgi:flagellar biosynthetic protein FliP
MKRISLALFFIILSSSLLIFSQDRIKGDDNPQEHKGFIPTQDFIKREDNPQKVATTLEIILLLTVLTLSPSILVMTTAFIRIVIVLSFLRRALATQDLPPGQVIIGIALILTFMVMSPTLNRIKDEALLPYLSSDPEKRITQQEFFARSVYHLRKFMFKHARYKDVRLFMDISGAIKNVKGEITEDDVPTSVLVPAFVISELRQAFIMGFLLFLPFMIIDMIVAATLLSMGMFVMPPILISLPFKILLFVLVDGWHLIIGSLVSSFYV